MRHLTAGSQQRARRSPRVLRVFSAGNSFWLNKEGGRNGESYDVFRSERLVGAELTRYRVALYGFAKGRRQNLIALAPQFSPPDLPSLCEKSGPCGLVVADGLYFDVDLAGGAQHAHDVPHLAFHQRSPERGLKADPAF